MLNKLSMSQCCNSDYMKGYNAAIERANSRVAELEEVATGNRLKVLQERDQYRTALDKIAHLDSRVYPEAVSIAVDTLGSIHYR
jgi:hypothetical protein